MTCNRFLCRGLVCRAQRKSAQTARPAEAEADLQKTFSPELRRDAPLDKLRLKNSSNPSSSQPTTALRFDGWLEASRICEYGAGNKHVRDRICEPFVTQCVYMTY